MLEFFIGALVTYFTACLGLVGFVALVLTGAALLAALVALLGRK